MPKELSVAFRIYKVSKFFTGYDNSLYCLFFIHKVSSMHFLCKLNELQNSKIANCSCFYIADTQSQNTHSHIHTHSHTHMHRLTPAMQFTCEISANNSAICLTEVHDTLNGITGFNPLMTRQMHSELVTWQRGELRGGGGCAHKH